MAPAVIIVLDPNCGEQLEVLSRVAPIWVVATDVNRATYKRLWENGTDNDHRKKGSITDFKVANAEHRLKNLLDVLPNVEAHHALQEGGLIEVSGVRLGQDVIDGLKQHNFVLAADNETGILIRKVGVNL